MKALIFALVGCHGWTAADSTLEAIGLAVNAEDWRQSETITKQGSEWNPIIGAHGDRVPLDVYCGSIMLLHMAVSALLPEGKWRTAWQGLSAGVEADVVFDNWRAGYR